MHNMRFFALLTILGFALVGEVAANEPAGNATDVQSNVHVSQRPNENKWEEPREEELEEAANYGLQSMNDLYYIKEPKLYSMGLYLENDDPAKFVAAFNDQNEEARRVSRFGFAILEGTRMFAKKFSDISRGFPPAGSTRKTALHQQCPRRNKPECTPASLRYRTSDGSCNNLQHLWWGSAMSTMHRFLPAVYEDGIQSVRMARNGRALPSAREVSRILHEDKDVPLASVTHMLMQWGQFIDHDITATGQSRGFNGTVPRCCLNAGAGFQPHDFMHPECLPIAVSPQDSFYGPLGVRCLEFVRSGPAPREDCEFGPREQLNQVTSYLDASTVYSSNALQSDSLRLFRNGLLQYGKIQSRRPLLPRDDTDLCRRGSLSTSCFRAGDGRLTEQPALTSLHVLFLRLHNRIATKLAGLNAHWSDEKLFQESRRIVGALVQHITYREFLPIVLGHEVAKIFDLEILPKGYYRGYDPSVNPTVANAFSSAAYRFGHSLVQRSFVRYDKDHRPIFNNVSIHEEFANPVNLESAGSVDRLLLGLVNQPSQRRDEFISDELTNHLFQTPRFPFGMDLASLNVQRGRDHGIPAYVDWREPCALSPIRNFLDLENVMSPGVAKKFSTLYSSVEDIDLFSGGLAEKSVSGALVGPTFACIIAQQFSNLRRGDRFWYENPSIESGFTAGQLQQIRRATLAQILCQTMDNIDTIQPFVFLISDNLRNRRLSCDDDIIGQMDLSFWTEDSAGAVRSGSDDVQEKNGENEEGIDSRIWIGDVTKPNGQDLSKLLLPIRKPTKAAGIHQQNRIVVKRPFSGRPDNVTIVVQNNAVNSPVFVNDAIYGSNIHHYRPPPTKRPTVVTERPTKPIPTAIPSAAYLNTHRFDDTSNPNPGGSYAYRPSDDGPNNVIFENYSPLTARPPPTLYTYYTNFHRKPTTPAPAAAGGGGGDGGGGGGTFQDETFVGFDVGPKYPTSGSTHENDQIPWLQRPNYAQNYGPNPAHHQSPINIPNRPNYSGSWEAAIYQHESSNVPYYSIHSNSPTNVGKPQADYEHAHPYLGRPPKKPAGQSVPHPRPPQVQAYQEENSARPENYWQTAADPPVSRPTARPAAQPGAYHFQGKPGSNPFAPPKVLGTSHYGHGTASIDVVGEIPRPLTGKPGQLYYVKNVLHRYPDTFTEKPARDNNDDELDDRRKIFIQKENISESSYVDEKTNAYVISEDGTRLVTTPTIVLDDDDFDLDGAFSEKNIETRTETIDRGYIGWLDSEEKGQSSSTQTQELPRPMKLAIRPAAEGGRGR